MVARADLTIVVRQEKADVAVLDIHGDVTSYAEDTLMDAYTRATDAGAKVLVLNFNGLTYMNSSGIGLLVTLLIRVNRAGQRLFAIGLNEHYRYILELAKLDEAIHLYENEAEALAAV